MQMNYWDFIKIKSSAQQRKQIDRVKRQPMNWGKIFADHIPDKGLISKIYKELLQLDSKNKTKHQIIVFKNGQRTWIDISQNWTCKDEKMFMEDVREKMFNISNCQGNANQNQNEMSPHSCHYLKKMYDILVRIRRNWNSCMLSWWECKMVQPLWKKQCGDS